MAVKKAAENVILDMADKKFDAKEIDGMVRTFNAARAQAREAGIERKFVNTVITELTGYRDNIIHNVNAFLSNAKLG